MNKNAKRAISIVALLIIICGVLHPLGSALTPVSYTTYFEHDLETIKENGDDVDLIILGASRSLKCFVPSVFEKEMELHGVLNASSVSQTVEGSYYMLKELLKDFHPKYVVLGLVVNGFRGTTKTSNQQAKLIVYDRLSGLNKLEFLFKCFALEDYIMGIYAYRYRNNLSEFHKVMAAKQKVIDNDYVPARTGKEYYYDRGFIYGITSCEVGNIAYKKLSSVDLERSFVKERVEYLDKIYKLCSENGIQLLLTSAPTTDMRLYSITNYQDGVDYLTQYAEKLGVPYHNLNYLVGRNEWLGDDKMFDYNHVSGEGAEIVTMKYCELLNRYLNGDDISDLLYKDLDDYKKTVHRIVCVDAILEQDTNDKKLITVKINSWQNDDITPLYQIEVSYGNNNWETLVPWTEEREFEIVLKSNSCKIKVSASTGNHDDHDAYRVYTLE